MVPGISRAESRIGPPVSLLPSLFSLPVGAPWRGLFADFGGAPGPPALGLFLLWAVSLPPPTRGEADHPPAWEADYADYRTDVEVVRAELRSILEGTDLWDREVPPILRVIECERETIVLRALCSGCDPAGSWDLHGLVRERLITFIKGLDGGRFLPRRRVELVDAARPDGVGGGHPDEAEVHGDGVVPDRDRHRVG
jgi:hypothetical protein